MFLCVELRAIIASYLDKASLADYLSISSEDFLGFKEIILRKHKCINSSIEAILTLHLYPQYEYDGCILKSLLHTMSSLTGPQSMSAYVPCENDDDENTSSFVPDVPNPITFTFCVEIFLDDDINFFNYQIELLLRLEHIKQTDIVFFLLHHVHLMDQSIRKYIFYELGLLHMYDRYVYDFESSREEYRECERFKYAHHFMYEYFITSNNNNIFPLIFMEHFKQPTRIIYIDPNYAKTEEFKKIAQRANRRTGIKKWDEKW